MRAWGVIALVVTTTLALVAGMLTLGPYGVPDGSFVARDPSGPSPRRGMQAPMIIAPPTIDLEPSSHAPLLIEIGPPEWVPHDSILRVQGLPPSVTLSYGRRVSSKLWAVPIAALSKVRIDVAANAVASQSDVTLTLIGSDGSHIAEAHTAIAIDALTVADAKEAANDASGAVSRPQPGGATSPPATAEASQRDRATLERKASGTSAASEADRSAPGTPSDQRASGEVVAAGSKRKPVAGSRDPGKGPIADAKGGPSAVADKEAMPAVKGPAVVVQRDAAVAPPEPAKPASAATSEGAGLAAAKGGPKKATKADTQSVHPILGEEIASQRTIKGAAVAPADKDAASAPSPEAAKPSIAASETAGEPKGGPAAPAKSTAQSVRSVDAQREERSAPAAPADKEPAPSLGPAAVAQREPVASPERAKPPIAASETVGLVEPKAGPTPATPARSDAQSPHPIEREVAGQSAGKGPAAVADREAAPSAKGPAVAAALPEPAKPSSTAASEVAGHAAPTRPVEKEEVAARREVTSASPLPAGKQAAPSPEGPATAVQPVVPSELAKPSVVASAVGLDAPNGGPTTSVKGDIPSAHPLEREEIAARREPMSASPLPAGKQAAPLSEGPATAAQPVAASELTKPTVTASEVAGLVKPNVGPATSATSDTPIAHPAEREVVASQRRSATPADNELAPSPEKPAAVAQRTVPEPARPASEAGPAGAKAGPPAPARSAASGQSVPGEENAAQREGRGVAVAAADKEPAPSRKGPIAVVTGEPAAASPEPAKPSIAASEAAGLAAAKEAPATPAKSEVQRTDPMERGEVAGQSEGRGASAAAAAPAPKGPAQREAVAASSEPAKPKPSSTATSEAAGLAGVKAEPTKPANRDAHSLHPIHGEEIASQREIKSAFAAPVDADAARGKASRGDLQEGERYVARGEESLAAGNVAVAREFFLRAADAGAARGALLLASTYDPYELVGLHVVGVQPNIDLAQRWYKRAEALGEKHASERITRLERR
jgi:hypothetical protein